jgi:hypothetical protein
VGTVGERVPIPSIRRIKNLQKTFGAGCYIRKDESLLFSLAVALAYLKLLITHRIKI